MKSNPISSRFISILESSNDIASSYRELVPNSLIKAVEDIDDADWKLYFLQWGTILQWIQDGQPEPMPAKVKKVTRKLVKHIGDFNSAKDLILDAARQTQYGYDVTDLAYLAEHLSTFINKGKPTYISTIANMDKWSMTTRQLRTESSRLERFNSIKGIPEEVVDDNEDEILIDFGDGFAWWNLNRSSCSWEAKAGGHCGNSPREDSNDIILSLREKKVDSNGKTYYKVHLTFILSYGGYLTEMKARFNEKPGEEYHKYIVPLLEHPIVKGIAEGFYATENDFSMEDLPESERERLLELKPGLDPAVSASMIYKDIKKDLMDALEAGGYNPHDIGGNEVIISPDYDKSEKLLRDELYGLTNFNIGHLNTDYISEEALEYTRNNMKYILYDLFRNRNFEKLKNELIEEVKKDAKSLGVADEYFEDPEHPSEDEIEEILEEEPDVGENFKSELVLAAENEIIGNIEGFVSSALNTTINEAEFTLNIDDMIDEILNGNTIDEVLGDLEEYITDYPVVDTDDVIETAANELEITEENVLYNMLNN